MTQRWHQLQDAARALTTAALDAALAGNTEDEETRTYLERCRDLGREIEERASALLADLEE